jgi:hypothetical protein
MAIGVQLDYPGVTLEQYDRVLEELGLLPGGPPARSQIFHWVAPTENGIRVVDVWESQDAFEAFWEKRIRPVMSVVGLVAEPVIEIFDVHNYFAGGSWRR